MKQKSKFEFCSFYGGYDTFAVNRQKYTKEEAIEIAKFENDWYEHDNYVAVGSAFVRHRAGVDDDGERHVCWWLEYEEHKRACPVWCFHIAVDPSHDSKLFKGYEYIKL